MFDYILRFDIGITPYNPLGGSSYIPLPDFMANKKAVINVQNRHNHECAKWSITAAVFPVEKDPQRLTKKMRENSRNFNCSGMNSPCKLNDFDIFLKSRMIMKFVLLFMMKMKGLHY